MKSDYTPHSKAELIEIPGQAIIIHTDDNRAVILTPVLAIELAREIIKLNPITTTASGEAVFIPADPSPARAGLVQ